MWHRLSFLVCLLLAFPLPAILVLVGSFAAAPARADTGIGVLPFTRGQGDDVEQVLYEVVSRLPGITGLWAPTPDFDTLLSALAKARDEGKKIDLLVIGAHGSRTAVSNNSPALGFSGQDLVPAEVDLAGLRFQSDRLLERLLDVSRAPNPKQCTRWKELRDRIRKLESVADAFAPGARVLLINCGAAGSQEGVTFVGNLGRIFLGRNGGVISASRIDVSLNTDTWAHRRRFVIDSGGKGRIYPVGDYFFGGDFVDFPVAANALTERTFPRDLLGTASVRVLDARTGQALPGAKLTLAADGRSVVAGVSPATGDPLALRAPAVLAGAPMRDSVERGTDPTALRRYQARAEAPGYLPATMEVAFSPDSDLDANCVRVKPLDLVVRLSADPTARNPGGKVHLELVEAIPDKNPSDVTKVDAPGGSIIYDAPCCGHSEHRWDPPPQRIEPGEHAYPMGIFVSAKSLPKNRMSAGITVKLFAGVGLVDSNARLSIEAQSEDARTATASSKFAFRPPTELGGWPLGTEAWILVEGGGRTAYYHYKVMR